MHAFMLAFENQFQSIGVTYGSMLSFTGDQPTGCLSALRGKSLDNNRRPKNKAAFNVFI